MPLLGPDDVRALPSQPRASPTPGSRPRPLHCANRRHFDSEDMGRSYGAYYKRINKHCCAALWLWEPRSELCPLLRCRPGSGGAAGRGGAALPGRKRRALICPVISLHLVHGGAGGWPRSVRDVVPGGGRLGAGRGPARGGQVVGQAGHAHQEEEEDEDHVEHEQGIEGQQLHSAAWATRCSLPTSPGTAPGGRGPPHLRLQLQLRPGLTGPQAAPRPCRLGHARARPPPATRQTDTCHSLRIR